MEVGELRWPTGSFAVKRHSESAKKVHILNFDPTALRYVGKHVDPLERDRYTKLGEQYNMCFKMIKCDSRLVKSLLFSYGFLQCSSKNQKCNLMWTNTHLSTHTMRNLRPWQRANHFPRSWMLTKKDQLYENIDRASILYGSDWFDFIPEFYCTPLLNSTLQELLRHKLKESELGLDPPFIVKPADGSLGRGIYFLNSSNLAETLDCEHKLVISRYIARPYLLNGLKWDLRIYVLVTSFHPLIVYIYSDGLARFAVHKYQPEGDSDDFDDDFGDLNRHLTNYSLNKYSDEFVRNNDCTVENMGHKWTLGALLRELDKSGVDTGLLVVRIEDIVIKSLLSVQSSVGAMCRKLNIHPKCCFELFGFDILVDEHLKPWLLEVNLSPCLTCDSPLDSLLKTHLFCNALNIAQVPLVADQNVLNECYNEEEENGDTIPVEDSDHSNTPMATPSTSQNSVRSSSSSSSSSSSNSANGLKRKSNGTLPRTMAKLHKMEQLPKVSYSADRITPQYLDRVRCHFEKFKSEERRKGRFNRIFPRRWTWDLYRMVLEDAGQEKWDEALHERLRSEEGGKGEQKQHTVTQKDIQRSHEQLMDAKRFKHRDQLDPVVREVILADALREAECYKRRRYSADIVPFPSALPRVRQSARRRTKSQVVADEVRREKLEQLRRERAEEAERKANNEGTTMKPLVEVSMNMGDNTMTAKLDGH